MPLYEYLIITRPGPALISSKLIQEVVASVLTNHPNVKIREVQNLGDRVMGQRIIKNKLTYTVGRYLQIMLDAPPSINLTIRRAVLGSFSDEVFRTYMHKVDDLDYAINTYFRANRLIDPFNDKKDYEYAQRVMKMKEKVDKLD